MYIDLVDTISYIHNMKIQTYNGKTYKLYPNERYFSRGIKKLHRVVWETHNGEIPEGYDIHHIDNNTHNNDINNLMLIERMEHQKYTSQKRVLENPDFYKLFQAMGIESAKEWHKSEEGREWHSKQAKESYTKREYRTLICEVCGKEYQTRHTGITKYCHNNCKAKAFRFRNT